jgi:muramoyltetrapeptide carboxypeptidase LdcA involved in peptidoglycan recycling
MPSIRQASCSDPLNLEAQTRWEDVRSFFRTLGHSCEPTDGGADLWGDPWWLVADPTGGSQGLQNLPRLVAALPPGPSDRQPRRAWCSLSDNCLTLNTLLDRGLCRVLHGQLLALAGRNAETQRARFELWSAAVQAGEPFPEETLPRLTPLRGSWSGPLTLVGGNLGALERLGTTPWRPAPGRRTLLLESLSLTAAEAPRRVVRLVEDPWWRDIEGLVLGRFTVADRDQPEWIEACLRTLPRQLSVARLPLVGHGADTWTIPLGEPLRLCQE